MPMPSGMYNRTIHATKCTNLLPSHTQVQYLIMHFCFVLHSDTTPSYVLLLV